jgi:diguanylate cyclase (GGDEF)-like protein/PAS domain S-box-containing protein
MPTPAQGLGPPTPERIGAAPPGTGRPPVEHRDARAGALAAALVVALIAAICWGTWEGLRADRAEAGAAAAPAAQGERIALGLFLALAAAACGVALVRRARRVAVLPPASDAANEDQVLLKSVLEGTMEAMILADTRGRIRLMNPAAEILFGSLAEDLAGSDVQTLFPNLGDAQDPSSALGQIARGGHEAKVPTVLETEALSAGSQAVSVRLWVRCLALNDERYLLIAVQDTTEQDQQRSELAQLRSHDQLTGLLTRQELHARLAAIAPLQSDARGDTRHPPDPEAPAQTPTTPPAGTGQWVLLHMDMDQFTLINNTCGSAAGDKLLQQMARLIETKLAGAELVARLGGDEFAALLRATDIDAAVDLGEAVMQTVRGFLFTWQDRSFDIAMSIGIAAWDPLTEAPDDALAQADSACQLAKRGGRNRIHVYREGEAELVRLRGDMRLVSTITQALSDGSFNLFAQPIVPIGGDPAAPCHYEILVRMVDGTGALVAPARFIPAAEHYILMPMVDRWIVSHLFALQAERLRAWHLANPDQFLFALNLSGTTVTDDGFLRYLKRQFAEWQVPYPSICFEITESAAVSSLERARTFIEELSALGCRFALDDFGTGLSSYAYLRALGVHYLKIDGSFVRGAATDEVNRAMVASINQIGHVLGLKTIAEWVEDEQTLAMLRSLQVDYAQGFAVGVALPLAGLPLGLAG